MNLEKLITCVHERPALWDQKNKHYHNRDIVRRCWSEVAEECESDSKYKVHYVHNLFTRIGNKKYKVY